MKTVTCLALFATLATNVGAICPGFNYGIGHQLSIGENLNGCKLNLLYTRENMLLNVLSRTSKDFQEPALNELWRSQETFAHILRCMPQDLWNMVVTVGAVDELDVVRPIALTDWERPLFYLNRIRSLVCNASDTPSADLFATLSLCLPQEHFFPNLYTLVWNYSEESTRFPYIRLLLSPHITNLEIELGNVVSHFSLIPTLGLKCPHLTTATIVSSFADEMPADNRLRASTSEFVRQLDKIEWLRVSHIDQSALEHIALLPSLTSLTIESLHQLTPFAVSTPLSDTSVFVNLAKLEVYLESSQVATDLTKALSHSSLTALNITITQASTVSDLSLLYHMIAVSCSPSLLRQLQIGAPVAIIGSANDHKMPCAAFEPLFPFTNLEIVWFYSPGGFDLDDDLLREMARAWPNLVQLTFYNGFNLRISSRITLAGLRPFARHCLKLKSLAFVIDASDVPIPESGLGIRINQPVLVLLMVGHSPIVRPSSVARFISGLFPNVQTLQTGLEGVVEEHVPGPADRLLYHRRWKEVQMLLPELVAARREEAVWAQKAVVS
ncbi:hypothetical protein FB451DRAFT_1550881 [Mycena latifolia]|nr:hypothetical protein FB451DRAFT_1550881 [Mycena latifolia]